jgi:hypothetical protein
LALQGISDVSGYVTIPEELLLLDEVEAVDEELVDEEASLLLPPQLYTK